MRSTVPPKRPPPPPPVPGSRANRFLAAAPRPQRRGTCAGTQAGDVRCYGDLVEGATVGGGRGIGGRVLRTGLS